MVSVISTASGLYHSVIPTRLSLQHRAPMNTIILRRNKFALFFETPYRREIWWRVRGSWIVCRHHRRSAVQNRTVWWRGPPTVRFVIHGAGHGDRRRRRNAQYAVTLAAANCVVIRDVSLVKAGPQYYLVARMNPLSASCTCTLQLRRLTKTSVHFVGGRPTWNRTRWSPKSHGACWQFQRHRWPARGFFQGRWRNHKEVQSACANKGGSRCLFDGEFVGLVSVDEHWPVSI